MSLPPPEEPRAVAAAADAEDEALEVGLADMPLFLFIRGLAALLLVTAIVVVAHVYIGVRVIDGAGLPPAATTALWGFMWAAFASIFVGLIGIRFFPRALLAAPHWLGIVWMGAFGLLLTATLATDAAFFVARHLVGAGFDWGRLQSLAIVGLVGPALGVGFVVARGKPKVERVEVPIAGLDPKLDGFKVVQVSDLHIGETLTGWHLQRVVDQVNALQPDLVAVTGDLVDGRVEHLREDVAPLAGLRATFGTAYVTGNHEYYHGGPVWTREVARLGLRVLHNEHVVLERDGAKLVVGGVPDYEGGRFLEDHRPDARKAFDGAPADAPRILLAHQPRFARHAQGLDVQLMLSGHTHGGQIFPFMYLVRLQQPVIAGLRTLWGVPTYTSRGTGYWGPPFRVGPAPEISELVLRAAPAQRA